MLALICLFSSSASPYDVIYIHVFIYTNFISRSSLYKSIRPCINEKIEIIFLSELTVNIIVMEGGSI